MSADTFRPTYIGFSAWQIPYDVVRGNALRIVVPRWLKDFQFVIRQNVYQSKVSPGTWIVLMPDKSGITCVSNVIFKAFFCQ